MPNSPSNWLTPADESRRAALLHVLRAGNPLPAQTLFHTFALGAVALAGGGQVPPEFAALVDGVGVNALSSLLARVARGEVADDKQICQEVQAAVAGSQIAGALTEDGFQRALARQMRRLELVEYVVRRNGVEIAEQLAEQARQYEVLAELLHEDLQGVMSRTQREEIISLLRRVAEALEDRSSFVQGAGDVYLGEEPNRKRTPPASPDGRPDLFMVPPRPLGFVERAQREALVARLLDDSISEPVAPTAVLRGAWGYGKTTLAVEICYDPRIWQRFPDGVLLVEVGGKSDGGKLRGLLNGLVRQLAPGEPLCTTLQAASARLGELLVGRATLLVVDDVWQYEDLKPFLVSSPPGACLVTTRNDEILPPGTPREIVGAMQPSEAMHLLAAGLPEGEEEALSTLAARLGNWPLLLALTNRTLHNYLQQQGMSLSEALQEVNADLDEHGLVAFDDPNDLTQRQRAVAATLQASLNLLREVARYGQQPVNERACFQALAIFPEDVAVPVATVGLLWQLDRHTVKAICHRLAGLSLLSAFDGECIRLHDVVRSSLLAQMGQEVRTALHHHFLACARALVPSGKWSQLPADEPYLWRYLGTHLRAAGHRDEWSELLLDFDWLQNKLYTTDIVALLADFADADDTLLKKLEGALRLSAHVLAQDKDQLASQLWGRLPRDAPELQPLLQAARRWQDRPWLRPLQPCLQGPGGPLIRTLAGHTDTVTGVALLPDGRRALSASWDKTLKLWDLESGQALRTLVGHTRVVNSVAILPDGRQALSASDDQTLKLWDLESGQTRRTLVGHAMSVTSVALLPDGRRALSTSRDKTLKLWDLESGQACRTLSGHTATVTSVAILPDGRHALSTSWDKTLKLWDLESGQARRTLVGHTAIVESVAILPDGRQALSASDDQTLKLWDLESGQELRTLAGRIGWVTSVALLPDGRHALSTSRNKTLKLWELESGQARRTLSGHTGWVTSVALLPDGRHVLSASWDQTLKLWDLESGQTRRTFSGHTDTVTSVALLPDGRHALSASWDQTLKLWDLESGQTRRTLVGHTDTVTSVALLPDGRYALSASWDQTLKLWDLESGQARRTFSGHTDTVTSVALLPDGRRALSASDDRTLKLWDLESGQELRTLVGHTDWVTSVTLLPDGRHALSGSVDRTLKLWDLESGQARRTLAGHTDTVNKVALLPDGRHALSTSWDDTLKLWDLESSECLCTFYGDWWFTAFTCVGDGRRVMVGDAAGQIFFLHLEGYPE